MQLLVQQVWDGAQDSACLSSSLGCWSLDHTSRSKQGGVGWWPGCGVCVQGCLRAGMPVDSREHSKEKGQLWRQGRGWRLSCLWFTLQTQGPEGREG